MKIPRFLPRFKGIHVVLPVFVKALSRSIYIRAITLFPFVIYRNLWVKNNIVIRNHEIIHLQQQMECGLVGLILYIIVGFGFHTWLFSLPIPFLLFPLLYYSNYFWLRYVRGYEHYKAYSGILFEREAYNKQVLLNYHVLRRPFEWIKYLKQK